MKVLIIGNAPSIIPDLSGYDEIVCFNDPFKEEYLKLSTQHWMRTNANGMSFNGIENVGKYNLKHCYISVTENNKHLVQSAHIQMTGLDVRKNYGCELNKNPSTGYIAIKYFYDLGYEVFYTGFTFNGIDAHNFSYEANEVNKYATSLDVKRKCHFVYYTTKQSETVNQNLLFALKSFYVHHRHWDIFLWTNANFKDVEKINFVNILHYGFEKYTNIGHKVDYARYEILHQFGGMYCDALDTITLGNFDKVYDSCDELGWSWCLGMINDKDDLTFRSGWLCINKPNYHIFEKILKYTPKEKGSDFEKEAFRLVKQYNIAPISYKYVYPIHLKYINDFFNQKSLSSVEFYPETLQFHYYTLYWKNDNILKMNSKIERIFNNSIEKSKQRSNVFKRAEVDLKEYPFEVLILNNINTFASTQKMLHERFSHLKNTLVLLGYNNGVNVDEVRRNYPNRKIIIYQLEQLYGGDSLWYNEKSTNQTIIGRTNNIKKALLSCDEIWDYDLDNIDFIKQIGIKTKIKHVPFSFCRSVVRENKMYDVLFFGSMNQRRYDYLKLIDERFNLLCIVQKDTQKEFKTKNTLTDVWGDELFKYIYGSKMVINLHYYESKLQEQVRLFELLSNNVYVLSEKSRRNYLGIDEFNTTEEMLYKIDNKVNGISKSFIKKPKIGAIYNSFYGLEQIESSIKSIIGIVDYFVIVHQKIGCNGQKEPKSNAEILDRLAKKYDVVYYENQFNGFDSREILNKRNIGLDLCRENSCEFIIPLDCDEEYNSKMLLSEIKGMIINEIDTLYSPIHSYYYDRNHYFIDTYFVPSVYRVNERNFKFTESSVLCDPVRKMREDKSLISYVPMQHYTYMKDLYKNKIGGSFLSTMGDGQTKIYNHLQTWKSGQKALVYLNDLNNKGVNYLSEIELITNK